MLYYYMLNLFFLKILLLVFRNYIFMQSNYVSYILYILTKTEIIPIIKYMVIITKDIQLYSTILMVIIIIIIIIIIIGDNKM